MKTINAIHDFTEKDAAMKRWHDIKGGHQMTIFERQEQRRKQYEMMQFKRAIWQFVMYGLPVALVLFIAYAYSDQLQAFFK